MTKQVRAKLHSLTDPIVLEGIRGINAVKEVKRLKGHLAGGMAVQSYLPEQLSRKTIDLDFRLLWGGIKEEFDEVVSPLREYLQTKGYKVSSPQREGTTYNIDIFRGSDSLVLQHQRASPNNFEKHKKSLEREMANQREITKQGIVFAVMTPEDIITHKLSRVLTFNESLGLTFPNNFCEFSSERLKKEADGMREGVLEKYGLAEPKDVAKLRVLYDCADVKDLASYAGLNRNYLIEAFEDWERSTGKTCDSLMRGLDFIGVQLIK